MAVRKFGGGPFFGGSYVKDTVLLGFQPRFFMLKSHHMYIYIYGRLVCIS